LKSVIKTTQFAQHQHKKTFSWPAKNNIFTPTTTTVPDAALNIVSGPLLFVRAGPKGMSTAR
jgi:hypothetical protein